jgi:CheY-like chemotaxis protein
VLIVDDCPDNRDLLAILLRAWGHEARVAPDGPTALDVCGEFSPHAVLLDIALPGPDGWEVGRQLREQMTGSPLLLVALTGLGRDEDKERSRLAGFDAHLTKPASADELRAVLAGTPALPTAR